MDNQFNEQYQQYLQSRSSASQTTPPGNHSGMQPKNIGLCIVFTLITCGFYGWYWLYCMAEDCKKLSGDASAPSGGMVLLLSIVTCNIYQWYWLYKQGDWVERVKAARHLPASHAELVYLLLGIFGFVIISWALLQNELNNMIEG